MMRYALNDSASCYVAPIAFAITATLAACGSQVANPFDPPPAPETTEAARPSFLNEISRDDILGRGSSAPTAYDVIQRLRPAWLLGRGQNSINQPESSFAVVYLDSIRHGPLRTLHQITPNQIERMEFIGTSDATTRWGTGHRAGVINVVTRH